MRVAHSVFGVLLVCARLLGAQAIPIDSDDIAGVVSGPTGPEAGVWVIAETHDLPTRFVRIVVTNQQGRYLLPDLPAASYTVWVRGYGLVDSPQVPAVPGKPLNLTAVPAPNPRAAAQLYPAGYWFSLMRVPAPSEFVANAGADGQSPNVKSQAEWLRILKSGRPSGSGFSSRAAAGRVIRWGARGRGRFPRRSARSNPRWPRGSGAYSRVKQVEQ